MSCISMMMPSSPNFGQISTSATSDKETDSEILGRAKASLDATRTNLLASGSTNFAQIGTNTMALSNAIALESMLAEEQRRRALMMASTGSLVPAGLSPAAALLARQQLLAATGIAGGPSLLPYDQLGLGLSSLGGVEAARTTFPPSVAALAPTSSALLSSLAASAGNAGGVARNQQQPLGFGGLSSEQTEELLLDAMEQQGRKGRTGTFPQKLHQMLADLEKRDGGTDIASYLPHGRSFAIHKPNEFVKQIMPRYFRMSRFSSFQRQLNLYEFVRVTEGPDKGSYFHRLFVRGRPILASQIRRNKIKGVPPHRPVTSESNTNATLKKEMPGSPSSTSKHIEEGDDGPSSGS